MKELKIGVVGLGHRGRELGKIVATIDGVKLAAACDIRPHNWYQQQWLSNASMAEMFPDAAFYEDYNKMLDEADIDAIIVETGADIHAEFCIKALKKNVNVLTDIPVVASLKEAEDIWNAAKESKAMIYVGSNPNFGLLAYLIKDFYDKGLLGKPYCMEAEYIHWNLPGNEEDVHINENGDWRKLLVPIRYCTHSLGPLLTIVDSPLRKVSCFGTGMHAVNAEEYKERKKDDMMCAQYQTESGAVIRIMRNGRCRAKIGHHNYRIFGTEGYFEKIERFGKSVFRYNSTKELDIELKEMPGGGMHPKYANNPKAVGHGGVDYAMLDNFCMALRGEPNESISLKDGLALTIPGIYAEESAKRGGEVITMHYPWEKDWTTEIE